MIESENGWGRGGIMGRELAKTEDRIILNQGKCEGISEKNNNVHDVEYEKTDSWGDCSVF